MRLAKFPLLGVFGGTFDPVHYGHLKSAEEVRVSLGISDFRMIPAGDPPHRDSPQTSAGDRLAMLRLGLNEFPSLVEDTREIERAGPSWMVDTLISLRAEQPGCALMLVLGQDAFNRFNHWHRWAEIFDLAHIVVMDRPGGKACYDSELADAINERKTISASDLSSEPSGRVYPVKVRQRDISSTEIRRRLRAREATEEWLPAAVRNYIDQHDLYR